MRVIEKCAFIRVAQAARPMSDLECRGPVRCSGPSASEAATKGPRHSKSRRFHGLAV